MAIILYGLSIIVNECFYFNLSGVPLKGYTRTSWRIDDFDLTI